MICRLYHGLTVDVQRFVICCCVFRVCRGNIPRRRRFHRRAEIAPAQHRLGASLGDESLQQFQVTLHRRVANAVCRVGRAQGMFYFLRIPPASSDFYFLGFFGVFKTPVRGKLRRSARAATIRRPGRADHVGVRTGNFPRQTPAEHAGHRARALFLCGPGRHRTLAHGALGTHRTPGSPGCTIGYTIRVVQLRKRGAPRGARARHGTPRWRSASSASSRISGRRRARSSRAPNARSSRGLWRRSAG